MIKIGVILSSSGVDFILLFCLRLATSELYRSFPVFNYLPVTFTSI